MLTNKRQDKKYCSKDAFQWLVNESASAVLIGAQLPLPSTSVLSSRCQYFPYLYKYLDEIKSYRYMVMTLWEEYEGLRHADTTSASRPTKIQHQQQKLPRQPHKLHNSSPLLPVENSRFYYLGSKNVCLKRFRAIECLGKHTTIYFDFSTTSHLLLNI